jgi:hypothetical protein
MDSDKSQLSVEVKPHRVQTPIQLVALWMVLVPITLALIVIGVRLTTVEWQQITIIILGVVGVIVVTAVVLLFPLTSRERLLGDEQWVAHQKNLREISAKTEPDVEQVAQPTPPVASNQSWETREQQRRDLYQRYQGLFLVHSAWPSQRPRQVADIALRVHQHGKGPMTAGTIKSVEYHLGPKFSKRTITKANAADGFQTYFSAYGPLLCLARVHFDDGSAPLDLERYIDIPWMR